MYKKCLANCITRNDKDYTCYLCHHVMKDCRLADVTVHIGTENHQNNLDQIDKEKRKENMELLLKLTTKKGCKKLVKNLIIFDQSSSNFICQICKCRNSGLPDILKHIQGSQHQQNKVSVVKVKKKKSKATRQHEKQVSQVSCDTSSSNETAVKKSVSFHPSIPILQRGSNGITIDEHNNLYCNICKINIIPTPNISEHMQGLLHQYLQLQLTNSSCSSKPDYIAYDNKCSSYYCTLCKCKIVSNPNVTQHIEGFMHQTMLSSQKAQITKAVESTHRGPLNQTTLELDRAQQTNKVDSAKQDENLKQIHFKSYFTEISYCIPCQTFVDDNTLLKCHVLLHLYQEFDSLRNLDLIQFELKPNKKLYLECLLCNSFICESLIVQADYELTKHFETGNHLGRLALFKHITKDTIQALDDKVLSDINLENSEYQPEQFITLESLCNACNVPVFLNNQKEHASGKNHNKNMLINAYVAKETEFNTKVNLDYYPCFICGQSFFEGSKLLEHFITSDHQSKIITLNMINKCPYMKITKNTKAKNVIVCTSCNTSVYSHKAAFDHMLGKKHKEKSKLPTSNWNNTDSSNNNALSTIAANKFENMNVKPENAPSQFTNSSSSTENKNVAVIKTKSLQKIKKAKQFEASIEELHELGFDAKNILLQPKLEPDMINETLDSLVQLNFSNHQIRRLPSLAKPKSPRTPKIEDHRKSFATNVLLNGKTFVKFCIDPGLQNIYNRDDEKFSLLKLGVTLTFPYYSERVCIPCEKQFPDNIQSLFEHLKKQEHLKIICDMLIDDEEFRNCPEQFSDLELAKLHMRASDSSIECYACDIRIEDKDNIIREHAEDPAHKERSELWKEASDQLFNQYSTIYQDIWYYAEFFFCEVCKQKCEFEIDFAMHLIHPEHMKKVYELKHKGTNVTFDLCPSCITYWFGKTDSYELHCQSNFHKRFVTNKDFMVPTLTINASEYLDNINKNIELLVSESDKVNLEKDLEQELLNAIVETVKPVYPSAEAYIFGSRLSDSGFPESDADIFLDCGNLYFISSTKEQSQQYINSLKNYFNNSPGTWVTYEVLLQSRIPIMKLRHIPTNLKCDISFTNGLGVEKSQLIGLYNRSYPICRKLILFMKKWLTLCRIFGPDFITTFSISWCIIFYLQLQKILPSVDELIKRNMESKIVDGWECGYERMITAESSDLSFEDHLKGFFTYFANFDYQNSVICPYLGKTIDKHTFAYTDELPAEMDIYKRRLKKNEVEIFRFDSPMCIQDPIDLSQNLTKAVKKRQLRCFRQYCMLSAAKCQV